MVVLSAEDAAQYDDLVLKIDTYLGSNQATIPEATRLALLAAHKIAAAVSVLNSIALTYDAFLETVVSLGAPLGRKSFRPDLKEWLGYFLPTGETGPSMPSLLTFLGLAPLTPFIPEAATVIPTAAPQPQRCFSSQDHLVSFNTKIPLCHVRANTGIICPFAPGPNGSNLCDLHLQKIASLSSPPAKEKGSESIFSVMEWFSLRVPTLEALAEARSLNTGESSFLAIFSSASLDPSATSKPKVSPLAILLEKEAVIPESSDLRAAESLPLYYPATSGYSVESQSTPGLGHSAFTLNPGPTHVSHVLWGLRKYLGPSAFAICFSQQGTVLADIKRKGSYVTSMNPLQIFFLKWGFAAFPAGADLFGAESSELSHLENYTTHNPSLGIPLHALAASTSDFLLLLDRYHECLFKTVNKGNVKIPSILLTIFGQWLDENGITGDMRSLLIKHDMHLFFNVNQWISACFSVLHEQAKSLLESNTANEDAEAFHTRAALLQCFRNLGSNPGVLSLVDTTILSRKGTYMANFSSLSAKDPMLTVNTELKTPAALLRARLVHATKHMMSRSSVSIPDEETCKTAKALAEKAFTSIKQARSPAFSASIGKAASPGKVLQSKGGAKRPFDSHEEASLPQSQLEKADEEPHQAWLDKNLPTLLKGVPILIQDQYVSSLKARLKFSTPVRNIHDSSINNGWKQGFFPLYRLMTGSRHTTHYCFACGISSLGDNGHTVYNCDMMLLPKTNFSDIPAATAPAHHHRGKRQYHK